MEEEFALYFREYVTLTFDSKVILGKCRLRLKTYAAISNAHLSRVCKREKLSGSCLSTINGFGSTQLPIFICHIGVPTFFLTK